MSSYANYQSKQSTAILSDVLRKSICQNELNFCQIIPIIFDKFEVFVQMMIFDNFGKLIFILQGAVFCWSPAVRSLCDTRDLTVKR